MKEKTSKKRTHFIKKWTKKKTLNKESLFRLAAPAFPVRFQTSIIGSANLTSVFGMVTGVSLHL